MFDPLPERAAGMNSTRTAQVLNFRKDLPPLATVAHVHALSTAHTVAEREIAALAVQGVIRKLTVPGRGVGRDAVGECVVLTDAWTEAVHKTASLTDELKGMGDPVRVRCIVTDRTSMRAAKYIHTLRTHPYPTVPRSTFSLSEMTSLLSAGFLVSTSQLHSPSSSTALLKPDPSTIGSLASLSTVAYRNPAGTIAAVGGSDAVHNVGGSGSALSASAIEGISYNFSLPSTGIYLRLLTSARAHLLTLLSKSKYREAPADLLRERWDGGIAAAPPRSDEGARGMGKSVLPGQTKKWKQFHGLSFRWILEECLGAGLVECFDTGTVGVGVRVSG